MKNLILLILFFAFALNSCEEKICCDPEIEPINDVLDFSEILSLMGGELDQTRDKIPGQYFRENTNQEETVLLYHMIPANTNMNGPQSRIKFSPRAKHTSATTIIKNLKPTNFCSKIT